MGRIIYTGDSLEKLQDAIFLAGPSYRPDQPEFKNPSWRYEFIEKIRAAGFDGDIIVPEFEDRTMEVCPLNRSQIIKWEFEGLSTAHRIVFNLCRDVVKLPGLLTNFELGYHFNSGKINIIFPTGGQKNESFMEYSKLLGISEDCLFADMDSAIHSLMDHFEKPPVKYFVSDTHFNSERTLTLSRRPFRNLEHMDYSLISNINGKLRQKDYLYHLGDFGDLSYLYKLNTNSKNFKFLFGNYERNEEEEVLKFFVEYGISEENLLQEHQSVTLLEGDEREFEVKVIHEPDSVCITPLLSEAMGKMYLYGHIHGRQFVKHNGIDVGVDSRDYQPFSEEDIYFFYNALCKGYYDNNVYSRFAGGIDVYLAQSEKKHEKIPILPKQKTFFIERDLWN